MKAEDFITEEEALKPEILAAYEKIQPGLADRIVAMIESERTHRQRMNELQAGATPAAMRVGIAGIITGFMGVFVGAVGGGLLAWLLKF